MMMMMVVMMMIMVVGVMMMMIMIMMTKKKKKKMMMMIMITDKTTKATEAITLITPTTMMVPVIPCSPHQGSFVNREDDRAVYEDLGGEPHGGQASPVVHQVPPVPGLAPHLPTRGSTPVWRRRRSCVGPSPPLSKSVSGLCNQNVQREKRNDFLLIDFRRR